MQISPNVSETLEVKSHPFFPTGFKPQKGTTRSYPAPTYRVFSHVKLFFHANTPNVSETIEVKYPPLFPQGVQTPKGTNRAYTGINY